MKNAFDYQTLSLSLAAVTCLTCIADSPARMIFAPALGAVVLALVAIADSARRGR